MMNGSPSCSARKRSPFSLCAGSMPPMLSDPAGRGVMDSPERRSAGVSASIAMADRPPADAPLSAGGVEAPYRATVDDLYAYAATLLRDRGAAEDVVAATVERAYRGMGSFAARRGSARQWLFGIARHAALDELRRRRRAVPLAADSDARLVVVDDDAPHPGRRAAV